MGHNVTLGGDRLGGGKKNTVHLHGYERSTHDLSRLWRSTMAPGTLVPFLKEVALPGDTFDIELESSALTLPTIGPLFGSFKLHKDIFLVPMRLYQAALHMNMLNVGNDMSQIALPQVELAANNPVTTQPIDNQQVNPSCIFRYLGISGLGKPSVSTAFATRQFNAIPWLAYWDIYKNYYANKQEGIGAVLHMPATTVAALTPTAAQMYNAQPTGIAIPVGATAYAAQTYLTNDTTYLRITFGGTLTANTTIQQIQLLNSATTWQTADYFFNSMIIDVGQQTITLSGCKFQSIACGKITMSATGTTPLVSPQITTFTLADIDSMRSKILRQNPPTGPAFVINQSETLNPYKLALDFFQTAAGPPIVKNYSIQFSQEGLGLRTYASDLFNNWINTTYITGASGITAVTSVNVVANKFTIDELNLNKKVYEMLNRIALSGGTYDDWLDAVYTQGRQRSAENPIYMGGQIKNIVFQEVISTADQMTSAGQPLGTLAGRGTLGHINKGGKIIIKVDEPSYIIGIVSIVPNVDYYQGNDWDNNLKTFNDLHKPALDEIGFQNLITDQMAWYDTVTLTNTTQTFKSAGKQPAWINYMTAVNKVFGNFADQVNMGWMVLTRRYDANHSAATASISDLTTYIDPSKFNVAFANTAIDAQNFMIQIAVKIEARRKMSAKVIPNL